MANCETQRKMKFPLLVRLAIEAMRLVFRYRVWRMDGHRVGAQFGIRTSPEVKVMSADGGGAAAIGGTLANVIGGAPGPRGVV